MAWISDEDLIELLRTNLEVMRLEAYIAEVRAETARRDERARRCEAELAARRLLRVAGVEDADALVAELPFTTTGDLHERALVALIDQHIDIDRLLAG